MTTTHRLLPALTLALLGALAAPAHADQQGEIDHARKMLAESEARARQAAASLQAIQQEVARLFEELADAKRDANAWSKRLEGYGVSPQPAETAMVGP